MVKRRSVIAGLALGSMLAVLVGCGGRSPTETTGSVSFQTVLKASLPGDSLDLPPEETVRDRGRWQELWAELHRGAPAPPPEIDFGREMVVMVIGPGCNGRVDISAVEREGSEWVVRAETHSCTNTICAFADFAVHAVRLPRFDGAVRFAVRRNAGLC